MGRARGRTHGKMPRKTRKQKERREARRQFAQASQAPVKREFEFSFTGLPEKQFAKTEIKKSDKSFYFYQTASTSRDLVKTVVLAALIFSLEIVIYFAWFKQTGIGYQIYNLINEQVNKL